MAAEVYRFDSAPISLHPVLREMREEIDGLRQLVVTLQAENRLLKDVMGYCVEASDPREWPQ